MFKHQITLLTQSIKDWEEDTLESYDIVIFLALIVV